MAQGIELAAAYISLTPSAKNIARELNEEIVKPADKAGKDAGTAIEKGIGGGATRGASAAKAALSVISSAAILSGLNRAKDAASGLQQAVGGTAAVFQEAGTAVDDFAQGAAEAVGLSERAARELTSQIGASLKGYGFAVDEAADKSIELVGIGADLAATFGGTTADAVAALSSALRGEFDPLERYGVALRQSAIDAKAVELGLAATTANVSAQARAQAALTLITEQSADAQGQFARESDSAAGQAQIAQAKMEDSAADLGEALLPIYAQISSAIGTVADVFSALPESVQTGIVALAGVVAVAGPVSNVVGLYRSFTPVLAANTVAVEVNAAATNSAAAVQTLYAGATTRAAAATRLATGALKVGATALAGYAVAAGIVNASREAAGESGEALADSFRNEFGAAETAADRVDLVNRRITEYNRVVDNANTGLDIFNNDDLAIVSREIGPVIEQETELIGVLEGVRAAGGDVNEANRILGTSYERIGELIADGYTPVQIVATLEAEQAAETQQDLATQIQRTTTVVADHEAAIEAMTSAMTDYVSEAFASQDATANWEAALDGLTESIEENGTTLDLSTEAGRENFEQGREVADGLTALMQRRFEETGSIQASIDAGNLYVEQLKDQLRQSGLTEDQVQTYIDTLHLTPTNIATNFAVNTREAVEAIQDLQRRLSGVAAGSHEVDVTIRDRRPQAAGGPVFQGEHLWVGEQGAEPFFPAVDGRILSHGDAMSALAMSARPSGVGAEAAFAVGMAVGMPPSPRQYVQNFYGPTEPERAGREVRRVEMVYR